MEADGSAVTNQLTHLTHTDAHFREEAEAQNNTLMEQVAPEGALREVRQYASVRQCEFTTATIEVLDLSRIAGRGKLVGLATVEVMLDGVSIIVQGWRLSRRADGFTIAEPPAYRHVDGDWVPAIVLPVELEDAIARAVLEEAGGWLAVGV